MPFVPDTFYSTHAIGNYEQVSALPKSLGVLSWDGCIRILIVRAAHPDVGTIVIVQSRFPVVRHRKIAKWIRESSSHSLYRNLIDAVNTVERQVLYLCHGLRPSRACRGYSKNRYFLWPNRQNPRGFSANQRRFQHPLAKCIGWLPWQIGYNQIFLGIARFIQNEWCDPSETNLI